MRNPLCAPGFGAEYNDYEDTAFFRGHMSDDRRAWLIDETHDKRPGRPEDIAAAVHFLASEGARHITGQTLHVNGGAYTTR